MSIRVMRAGFVVKTAAQRWIFFTGVGVWALLAAASANAQTYAGKERSSAALGHYARSRALLVEALAEFEQARKLAKPDLLIDSEEWRLSVISRTEELNRVLDPQPRVTRSGVRFKANGLQVRHANEQLPPVLDGAKASSSYGEEARALELEAGRKARAAARPTENRRRRPDTASLRSLESELNEFLQPEEPKPTVRERASNRASRSTTSEPKRAAPQPEPTVDTSITSEKPNEDSSAATIVPPASSEETTKSNTAPEEEKKSEPASVAKEVTEQSPMDAELDKVVEEAINERLKKKIEAESKEAEKSE